MGVVGVEPAVATLHGIHKTVRLAASAVDWTADAISKSTATAWGRPVNVKLTWGNPGSACGQPPPDPQHPPTAQQLPWQLPAPGS